MGRDSIINLLDKVSDNSLRSEMTDELSVLPPLCEGSVPEKLGELAGLGNRKNCR